MPNGSTLFCINPVIKVKCGSMLFSGEEKKKKRNSKSIKIQKLFGGKNRKKKKNLNKLKKKIIKHEMMKLRRRGAHLGLAKI